MTHRHAFILIKPYEYYLVSDTTSFIIVPAASGVSAPYATSNIIIEKRTTKAVTQIAKEFGWGPQTLNRKLKELGVQYKQNDQWILKAKYQNKGYTDTITREHKDHLGRQRTSLQTVWREAGRQFIHSLFD